MGRFNILLKLVSFSFNNIFFSFFPDRKELPLYRARFSLLSAARLYASPEVLRLETRHNRGKGQHSVAVMRKVIPAMESLFL